MFFGLKRKEVPEKSRVREPWRLAKWHALGNDFLFLDLRGNLELPADFAGFVRRCAERHFGFGCDQFILLENSADCALKVRFFNADASEAGLCGNALKCVAQMLAEEGLRGAQKIRLNDGVVRVDLAGGVPSVSLPLPREVRPEGNLFLHLEPPAIKKVDLNFNFKEGSFFYVELGNPHYVGLFEADVLTAERFLSSVAVGEVIKFFGAAVQRDFPRTSGVNVGFCVFDPAIKGEAYLRVFERGVGETLSCGSGAVAAAVALRELCGVSAVKVFGRGNASEYSAGFGATTVTIEESGITMQGKGEKMGEILIKQLSI